MDEKGIRMEHYGHLNKTERLVTLSSNIVRGTLVLESPEPFAGSLSYYGETPHLSKPLYVYLVLFKSPDLEQVARATEIVHVTFPWEFSAAFASISINFEHFEAIRIRNLLSFEHIKALQNAYVQAGLEMERRTHLLEGKAEVKIKKLFQLIKYPKNLFLDFDEKDQGYFEVPNKLSVQDYEALIKKVQNNTHFQTCDFAQGFFYSNAHIMDVIRVYHPELNIQFLTEVREAVLSRFITNTLTL